MRKSAKVLVIIATVLILITGAFMVTKAVRAASTETSAFVVVAYSSKDYEQNSIIINLYVTYAGPTVPLGEGIEEVIIEVVPGDSPIVIGQKMTTAVMDRATALGHPMLKGDIVLPSYQKGN